MRRLFRSSPSVLGAFLLAPLPALIRLGFNPTLVRLGPWNSPMVVVRDTSFNPTLVRLRHAAIADAVLRMRARFNPTLVRLRPYPVPDLSRLSDEVSIPRWFD